MAYVTSGLTVVFHYLKSMADLDTKIPPNSAPKSEVYQSGPTISITHDTVGGICLRVFSVTYYWGVIYGSAIRWYLNCHILPSTRTQRL